MDIVAVDILSGLPVTPDGMKYILVISDYFTKYSRAFALPDAEAATCMGGMYNGFFALFGLPRQLHSDMGKNFESKLFLELCRIAGVDKSRTTAFHPQSDGQVERLNRTILQMLRATADEDPVSWPQRLDTVMAAYRMTVHKVTRVTPNMAMLGREVLFPASLIARPPKEPFCPTSPFVSSLRDALRAAHQIVRDATKSTARTQKTYYDKRSKGNSFVVGQLVWLYWPRPPLRQRFRKLVRLWTGPWRIESFRSSIVAVIRHTKTKTKQTMHVDRLMTCRSPDILPSEGETPRIPASTGSPAVRQNHPPKNDSQREAPALDNDTTGARPQRNRSLPEHLEPYILD